MIQRREENHDGNEGRETNLEFVLVASRPK
jgi:hypothetical protein